VLYVCVCVCVCCVGFVLIRCYGSLPSRSRAGGSSCAAFRAVVELKNSSQIHYGFLPSTRHQLSGCLGVATSHVLLVYDWIGSLPAG
jgi:hypothetical protein